jgi:hypothetical protein
VRAEDGGGLGSAQIVGGKENLDLGLLGKGEDGLAGGLCGEVESDGRGAEEQGREGAPEEKPRREGGADAAHFSVRRVTW